MAIFLPYYVAGLALLALELSGFSPAWNFRVPRLRPGLLAAFLVAAYAAQLAVVRYGATSIGGAAAWRTQLPIPVAEHGMAHPDLLEAALLGLALAQSCLLFALFRAKPSRGIVAAGSVAMVVLSLAAPAFISPDPYAYVGDALLGWGAYAPPHREFTGEYALINRFFAAPMLPAPYGPLWLTLARLVTESAPTLLAKLVALRVFGAACFVALLMCLRAYGVPPRLLAIAAVNPAIAQQYIADAHNDLLGIAIVVAAAALVRRRRALVGSGVAAAAGLVKLPFTVLALPIFARTQSRPLRYACALGAIALAAAVSWLAGGAAYFGGLNVHVPAPGPVYALNAVVSIAALFMLGTAAIGARRRYSGVWLIAMMSSYIATWYAAYGLPYALARHRLLAYLLIALPFACALVDAKFMRPWTPVVLAMVVAAGVLQPRQPR
ncbi:MAG: hypothetical protein JO302_06075 [Candidatus Eremiobacteraeota bacterium]|nr:hypothetical protein [Candidatus Eremiobacteraeota bacterium]